MDGQGATREQMNNPQPQDGKGCQRGKPRKGFAPLSSYSSSSLNGGIKLSSAASPSCTKAFSMPRSAQ